MPHIMEVLDVPPAGLAAFNEPLNLCRQCLVLQRVRVHVRACMCVRACLPSGELLQAASHSKGRGKGKGKATHLVMYDSVHGLVHVAEIGQQLCQRLQ